MSQKAGYLLVICSLLLLAWAPWAVAQPGSRILVIDGSEQSLDLQPWLQIRRTDNDTAFTDILSGAEAWTSASNYNNMHFGYSAGALWMKITIQSAAPEATLWYLFFPYSSLSRVTLYQEGQPERLSGLGVPLAERDYQHRNPVFPIHLAPGVQTTLYLRAESVGSLGASSQLWSTSAFARQSMGSTAMVAVYYGLLLGLGVYHLLIAGLLRDRDYLLFGSHILFFALAVVAFSGLGARYLWPDLGPWGTHLLPFGITASNACALLLLRDLYTEKEGPGFWHGLLTGVATISALLAVFGLFSAPRWVSSAIPWLAILSTMLAIVCLIRARLLRLPGAWLFLAGVGFVALGIMLFALRAIGLVPAHPLSDLIIRGSSAVSLLIFAFGLASHTHWRAKRRSQSCEADLDSLRTAYADNQQQLEACARQLEEAEQRLEMAALEDPLTGLPNRTALDRHIKDALRRSKRRDTPLAVMLIGLDGLRQLDDQLGEQTTDRILSSIADRLRHAARDTDFLACLGGDEFVLIAEEVSDRQHARAIAEDLLDALLPSIELEGQSVAVEVSIGVTLTHAGELDMPRLLRQADVARYSRQRSGRGGVSFHSPGPVYRKPD